jgi:cell wall-associated NlpC family hydrolase
MPVLSAREIYRFARMAGFSPDQATTMTAIALAESGGNTGAHNPRGEDSRGLWQINVRAHPDLAGVNLNDPLENARAAFRISQGGADVSPWTTTHKGGAAKYLAYRREAEAAALAAGDGTGLGNWTGTPGYGNPLSAGAGGAGLPVDPAFAMAGGMGFGQGGAGGGANTLAQDFIQKAMAQTGDRYVFGAEAQLNDADPDVFDCSELTQWAAAQVGVDLPDGSWLQYQALEKQGGAMSVEEALRTPGALLFRFDSDPSGAGRPSQAHVAISLGDGRTIEARGSKYGVGSFEANTSRFNYAAVIPQMSGPGSGMGMAVAAGFPAMQDFGPAVDTDSDGLIDGRELMMGTNVAQADTDADGMSDGYELTVLKTNAANADTDGDRIGDAFELAQGFDPTKPDSDRDGILDGATNSTDSDLDGISDDLERLLGSNPLSLDSDADGFTDGLEYQGLFDPSNPMSNPMAPPGAGAPGTGLPGTGLPGSGFPGGAGGFPGTGLTPTGLPGGVGGQQVPFGGASTPYGDPALDDLGAS